MRIDVKVIDAPLLAAMRETRREMNQDVKNALLAVAQDVALPQAKRLAPRQSGRLARSLIAKATARNAYLTTSLTRRQGSRMLGLLEFGGTRRDVIKPRTRKALRVGDGFAAVIRTPRTYRAQGFMQRAAETKRVEINQRVQADLTDVIQRYLDRHSVPA